MKTLSLLMLFSACAFAQNDSPVMTVSQGAPAIGYQFINTYSGTNLTYLCKARSTQPTVSTFTISAASNAAAAVLTSSLNGLPIDGGDGITTSTPIISITGGTGNWAAVNGTWKATPLTISNFSIPVNSSGFGALTGTLVVTTFVPLTNSLVWAIQKFVYDTNSNLIWMGWATATTGTLTGGNPAFKFACDSLTTYGYQ